jgi:hypothetical protein
MIIAYTVIAVLTIALAISLYYVAKFSLVILKIEDAIEQSLDVLDERYRSISKVLEIPLFYDSPQIRQVINDIKVTRDTLLVIANKFASIDEKAVEEEERQPDQETNDV